MTLLGAYLTYPLYFWSTHSVFWSSFSASYFFNNYSCSWRIKARPQKPLWRRILVFSMCCLLYTSLWASWLYFNCSITANDGTQVKCRDSIRHFFGSPLWQDFKNVIQEMYNQVKYQGWGVLWRLLMEAIDPQGESNALKVTILHIHSFVASQWVVLKGSRASKSGTVMFFSFHRLLHFS